MPSLPSTTNVFGSIVCGVSLATVQRCLVERAGLPPSSLHLRTSSFDGSQTLTIRTELMEMEIRPGHNAENTWFFNGAVAGTLDEIKTALGALCEPLSFVGFPSQFEIYDEAFVLTGIAEFTLPPPGGPTRC